MENTPENKETFALKVKLRPVTRINRKFLIGVFMLCVTVMLMATLYGLAPTDFSAKPQGPELYNVGQKPSAETDARRAERLRQAQAAIRARESKIFFALNGNQVSGTQVTGTDRLMGTNSLKASGEKEGFELEQSNSPYQLMAGTIISASLITGINSDLPGVVMAQVTENIYDTVTGKHLLVPQGARLMGRYDSKIAQGQKRAMIIWQRLLMPNGSHITLDNMTASDQAGYSGLTDGVDFHTGDLMKGIALSTLLGVGTELAIGDDQDSLLRALTDSTQRTANKAGQAIMEQYLNQKPTLTIRPGWKLKVIVHKDLTLKPYSEESL